MTGIILAGGKSSRMGQDKGLMEISGKPLISFVIESVKPLVDEIIIISNNPIYETFSFPVYPDIYKDKGPLAGIYTGLFHSTTDRNLILACDTPNLSVDLLTYLASFQGYDVVIARHDGESEQLVGVYNKSTMPVIKSQIDRNQLKVKEAYDLLNVLEVEIDESLDFYRPGMFKNLNSPTDLIEP